MINTSVHKTVNEMDKMTIPPASPPAYSPLESTWQQTVTEYFRIAELSIADQNQGSQFQSDLSFGFQSIQASNLGHKSKDKIRVPIRF
jgi:hypothetical protein